MTSKDRSIDYEPSVSVIVPILNAEKTVEDLLNSLIEVDYNKEKLELIFVDGGSTDRTKEIIKIYPVILILENRKGLNVARNVGFRASKGEIIIYTDSDCVVPKDWVKQAVKNFDKEEVGCVGGNVSRFNETFLSRYADDSIIPFLRRFKKHEILSEVKPPLSYPAGCNMAFRREAIEAVGGFDEDIHHGFDEDELVERICKAGFKLVLDPKTMVKHQHRTNLRDFLRQTFNYGRGAAILIKRKKAKDQMGQWNLITLVAFMVWLIMNAIFILLSLFVNWIFLTPLVLLTPVPFALLLLYYVSEASIGKHGVLVVTYPFIDMFRLVAYCTGEIYGLLE